MNDNDCPKPLANKKQPPDRRTGTRAGHTASSNAARQLIACALTTIAVAVTACGGGGGATGGTNTGATGSGTTAGSGTDSGAGSAAPSGTGTGTSAGNAAPAAPSAPLQNNWGKRVSGHVEVGSRVQSGTVTIRCAGGSELQVPTVNDEGFYGAVLQDQQLPCIVRATVRRAGGATASLPAEETWHAALVDLGDWRTNVTPFTDLGASLALGQPVSDVFSQGDSTRKVSNVQALTPENLTATEGRVLRHVWSVTGIAPVDVAFGAKRDSLSRHQINSLSGEAVNAMRDSLTSRGASWTSLFNERLALDGISPLPTVTRLTAAQTLDMEVQPLDGGNGGTASPMLVWQDNRFVRLGGATASGRIGVGVSTDGRVWSAPQPTSMTKSANFVDGSSDPLHQLQLYAAGAGRLLAVGRGPTFSDLQRAATRGEVNAEAARVSPLWIRGSSDLVNWQEPVFTAEQIAVLTDLPVPGSGAFYQLSISATQRHGLWIVNGGTCRALHSMDGGMSWTVRQLDGGSFTRSATWFATGGTFRHPCTRIVEAGDTLYMLHAPVDPVAADASRVAKVLALSSSVDGGRTWTSASFAAPLSAQPGPGPIQPLSLLPDGRLVAYFGPADIQTTRPTGPADSTTRPVTANPGAPVPRFTRMATSSDRGATWTVRDLPADDPSQSRRVLASPCEVVGPVCVSEDGRLSADGITFEPATPGAGADRLRDPMHLSRAPAAWSPSLQRLVMAAELTMPTVRGNPVSVVIFSR